MKTAFFHAAFLLVVGLLFCENFWVSKRDSQVNFAIEQAIASGKVAELQLLEHQDFLMNEIEKAAAAYAHPVSSFCSVQAKIVVNLSRSASARVQKLGGDAEPIFRNAKGLRDTLSGLTDRMPDVMYWSGPILKGKQEELLAKSGSLSKKETELLQQLAELEFLAAPVSPLNYFIHKVGVNWGDCMESFHPAMCLKLLNPKVGEPVEADFILTSSHCRMQENPIIFLDGKRLDAKNGTAHFTKTFPAPGLQKLLVRGEKRTLNRQNEIDTLVVEREFEVNVPAAAFARRPR